MAMTRGEFLFLAGSAAAVAAGVAVQPTRRRESLFTTQAPVDWRAAAVAEASAGRMSVRWLGCPAFGSAQPHTWIQRRIEQAANLDLHPTFIDWNGYGNLVPLMLGAGDIPDIGWEGDPTQVQRNVKQGLALEIPYEIILKHAPTYVRHLNQYAPEAWMYARFQGRNWGLPTFAAGDIFPNVLLWRLDWLRNVGLSRPPETLDEMHTALWRFRHGDPDRNGNPDTYGMCPLTHWSISLIEVYSAFGILPADFILRGEQVVWGGVQPEARAALALLRKWYQEELIDPDFVIGNATSNPTDQKFLNGKTGYMFAYLGYGDLDVRNPNSRLSTMRALNPTVDLAAGPALRGIDGRRRVRVWGGPAHVLWFGAQLARQPEKVIRLLRLFESLAQDRELFLESRLGRRGEHWDWTPERGVHFLPPYDRRGEDNRNLLSADVEGAYGYFSPCAVPQSETNSLLPDGALAFRQTYQKPEWGFKNAIGKSDVVPSAGRYIEDIYQFQSEAYLQMIRGERPLEYFDDFVREWRERGGDVLTVEANAVRHEMQEVFRQVGVPAHQSTPREGIE